MSRIIISVITLFNIVGSTFAWYETCDQTFSIDLGQSIQILSPNYSNGFPGGSSCRYQITSPPETQIQVQCQIQIDRTPSGSCKDGFYISIDGINFLTSQYFCGTGLITKTSDYSQLTLAYTSYDPASPGSGFNCTLSVLTPPCDCGWSVRTRIVNGVNAGHNEYTPMVGLVALQLAPIFCGGTIISTTMVLTAASCLNLYIPSLIQVVVGSNTKTGTDSLYTKLYAAKRFIKHPTYSAITLKDNIGLIETATQIRYTRGVGPACLPFSFADQSFENEIVEAAGWGSTDFGGPLPNTLKKVSLKVISNSICSQSQMCTYKHARDTCQFDSGGPLYKRYGRLFLLGIISNAIFCGTSTPTVNTRITYYLPWIVETVETVSSETLCVK